MTEYREVLRQPQNLPGMPGIQSPVWSTNGFWLESYRNILVGIKPPKWVLTKFVNTRPSDLFVVSVHNGRPYNVFIRSARLRELNQNIATKTKNYHWGGEWTESVYSHFIISRGEKRVHLSGSSLAWNYITPRDPDKFAMPTVNVCNVENNRKNCRWGKCSEPYLTEKKLD